MTTVGHGPLDAMSSEFIAEIKDDLAGLEPVLLAMEQRGASIDDDLVNQAFRSIHSIKGGAGFIDFKELAGLGHAMENVLMRVREKTLVITPDVVDALLAGFDKMKLMVEQMGRGEACDCEKEKEALQTVLNPEKEAIHSPSRHRKKIRKTRKSPWPAPVRY
nr:hypothetical protein [Desulfobacula sp.]